MKLRRAGYACMIWLDKSREAIVRPLRVRRGESPRSGVKKTLESYLMFFIFLDYAKGGLI